PVHAHAYDRRTATPPDRTLGRSRSGEGRGAHDRCAVGDASPAHAVAAAAVPQCRDQLWSPSGKWPVRQLMVSKNSSATGTAASAPNPPSSTRTATARSPWNPANHECVRGGVSSPYSAVPVLPCTGSPGTSLSLVAVPSVTARR